MDYTIDSRPSYSLLEVTLAPGEQLVTEAGAMAWMDSNMDVETSVRGGLMSGVKRAIGGGESFFQNTYTAQGSPGVIGLAPGQPGDIFSYEMEGGELLLERGAYLASTSGIETNSDFQGLRGLFNEGLFILRVSGSGLLFFNAYGDIQEIEVDGSYVVDNGHAGRVGALAGLQADPRRAHPLLPLLRPDHHGVLRPRATLGPVPQPPLPRQLDFPLPPGRVLIQRRRRLGLQTAGSFALSPPKGQSLQDKPPVRTHLRLLPRRSREGGNPSPAE